MNLKKISVTVSKPLGPGVGEVLVSFSYARIVARKQPELTWNV